MKKTHLLLLTLTASFITGCANNSPYGAFRNHVDHSLYGDAVRPVHYGSSWGPGSFRNQMADHVVNPRPYMANPKGKKYYRSHQNLPRYHVTTEEQAKYHQLNSKLMNRMSRLRKETISTEADKNQSLMPGIPSKGSTGFNTTPSGSTLLSPGRTITETNSPSITSGTQTGPSGSTSTSPATTSPSAGSTR